MIAARGQALLFLAVLAMLTGCETTGDPRQGGLFGWSEAKAQQRQAERRMAVASAEQRLAAEQQRGAQLGTQKAAAARQLAAAADRRERAAAGLRMREARVRAKAALLEQESPTPATASRARRLRAEVETLLAAPALTAAERARQLHDLEAEIDAARASVGH